jgi:peptidoglycan/LPS O-acetylase OafA/YrhL
VTNQDQRYRPALDGLRAIAVLAVIVYHGRPGWLPGGWLGVDLFFVISGFLITTLLLAEHDTWGRINLLSFWGARARRLFPALALVLAAVLLLAGRLTLPARRGAVSDDVLATMGYIANWRFLSSDEGYFSAIAAPSPVRHAWSLAVEEQFYIIFPLLLIALIAVLRTRRALVGALAAGAVLSAGWMAHLYVPGVDPSRVYYGTDTRAFELLTGAALAAASSVGRTWSTRIEHAARIAAWPAAGLVLWSMTWWDEGRSFVFRGGLFVYCALAAVLVVTAWSRQPTRMGRMLAWEPLRRTGAMSYGLYLWHWPVMVFGTPDRIGVGGVPLFAGQVLVTFALASLSLRFVEAPIRRNGFRAVLPSRPVLSRICAAAAVPLLVAGALTLPSITVYASTGGSGSNLSVATPSDADRGPDVSVMVMGNSVPLSVYDTFPTGRYPDISLSSNAFIGCDPYAGQRIVDGRVDPPSATCATWEQTWPRAVSDVRPDIVALFVTQELLLDREVDGRRLVAGTPEHTRFIRRALSALQKRVIEAGAGRLVLVNLSCHRIPLLSDTEQITRTNDDAAVARLDAVTGQWADDHGVAQIDQLGFLCDGGYHDTINGVPLYEDGYHLDDASGPEYWKWFAPQLRQVARQSPRDPR